MGKHFWMKHVHDESHDKQPGCMWGLVHVLDYHHWHSNVRKIIQYRKNEGQTQLQCDWNPEIGNYYRNAYEAKKLLDDNESSHVRTKKHRAAKKQSLKARIKALIAEEISNDSEKRRGKSFQRTYSIHHLESLDNGLSKARRKWKHSVIFLRGNVEKSATQSDEDAAKHDSKQDPDVLEIFKVDKELLIKHLQDADESVANFSRSALGLNTKAKFRKSRSFPVAELLQRRRFKPMRLENKQKEAWPFPKEHKLQQEEVNKIPNKSRFEDIVHRKAKNGEKPQENDTREHTHRSSSLNESLDKYARLFENSFQMNANSNSSKSLKLINEYGHAPVSFRRILSLSNVDTYYSNSSFEVFGDDPSGNGLISSAMESSSIPRKLEENIVIKEENVALDENITDKHSKEPADRCNGVQIKDDDESLRLHMDNEDSEKPDGLEDEEEKLKEGELLLEPETDSCDVSIGKQDPENDEISDNIIESLSCHECPKKNNSELNYVRHLLDQSGIAEDASEITWHASDQPFGPQLFEEVESCWPHEEDKLTEDIWNHQMLFDLVNDVLVEVYDMSLPYYPKALSSSCRVRPFPAGNYIIEEVTANINSLLNMKPEEKQSLDGIIARDLAHDYSWMNLQLDSECVALDLEDRIFNELLEEVIFS